MEESVSVLLSSKIDACHQPSAPNIQICSEPFIPFFCCFYSIICSEKVEARVTLKFSLNIIPAIDCHRLNILRHYHPHCSHTNLILAKILLVSHCFLLKTKYNFPEKHLDSNVLLPIIFSNFSFHSTIRQCKAFNMHSPGSPCPVYATVFYTSLSSAIQISVLGYIVGVSFFVSPFLTKPL